MKATIESVIGNKVTRDIDTAESPISIIRKFYEEDPTAASQIFSNQQAIDQLMIGQVDETKSTFELLTDNKGNLQVDWRTPLCNQPSIKEALAILESEGQIPSFVVCVSSIVANYTVAINN